MIYSVMIILTQMQKDKYDFSHIKNLGFSFKSGEQKSDCLGKEMRPVMGTREDERG